MRGKGAAARGKVAVARGKGTAARGKGAAAWGEGSGRAGEGGGRAGEGGTRKRGGGGRAGGRRKRQMLMSLCTQARVCPFLQNSFGRCYVDITGDQVHPIEVGRTWSGIARDGVGWGGGCACRGAHQSRGCAGLGGGGARRVELAPGRRMRSLGRGVCALRRRGRAPGQRLQVPGRMVRAGAEWSHAGAEGARSGAEHVSLLETGIRNSYAPEVHYTLTSHHEARG